MAITFDTWRLNSALDLAKYAEIYAERGIVQIPDILTADSAEALNGILSGPLSWRVLATDANDKPIHFTQAEMSAMPNDKRNALFQDIMLRARQNRGFFYHTYPMIEAYMKGWDRGHPLHTVTEFINSEYWLRLGREVTGVQGITKADAHATAYSPSHFLTRHLDYGDDRERRAAYVLGMTKNWQPDWGGLLLFLNEKQDITEGYLPRYNVLTIFDIKYLHTVTQVSSFAGGVRRAVTGWFRDDPVARTG
ncbi:MAG: proline hydroxylase [Parvularcula sp.]|uniref:2OG-Fe(II) oxygenase n=1 Tax=Hyphococcus sp. TaxID=2038636 RepID=UPI000C61F6C4|nr:proline hydroxylase [Parvularcula sp.]